MSIIQIALRKKERSDPTDFSPKKEESSPRGRFITLDFKLSIFVQIEIKSMVFQGNRICQQDFPKLFTNGRQLDNITQIKLIKSVAFSSQGSHTGQLDFCNQLVDSSTTG